MFQFGLLCCANNPTGYSGLLGFWPLCGMGTFNSTATVTNCFPDPTSGANPSSMNDVWPYVYRTLTLQWTITSGYLAGAWQTMVFRYRDCCDQLLTVTTTSGGGFEPPASWLDSPVITPTTVQQTFGYPPGGGWGDIGGTGIFTAALSNQFAPADYAAAVANALALVTAHISSLPSPSSVFPTQSYWPSTTGTQSGNLPQAYTCAAALGMPTRDPGYLSIYNTDYPALAAIYDFAAPQSGAPPLNFGGVICLASNWILTGLAPGLTGSNGPDTGNHKTIYAQEFKLPFSMGPILQPAPHFFADKTSSPAQDPYAYPNPISPVQPITFLPDDVLINLAAGGAGSAQYGILGFNTGYTGAPPIYVGAFPASGGAGGSGPGAGGGAPPM